MTRSLGVEEELLLVDPDTGDAAAVASEALRRARPEGDTRDGTPGGVVEEELQQEQIETDTTPCTDLAELAREVRAQRVAAGKVASSAVARVAALATSPLQVDPTTTAGSRYGRMVREFGATAREALSCGMHVHVEIASPEEGVGILDRILLAGLRERGSGAARQREVHDRTGRLSEVVLDAVDLTTA